MYTLVKRIVTALRISVCSLSMLANAVGLPHSSWQWLDVWEPPWAEDLWRLPPSTAPGFDWEYEDPACLLLEFRAKSFVAITWLHPTKRRRTAYEGLSMRNEQQKAEAFGYELIGETPEGYDVIFQPIDPISGAPLPLRATEVLFPRSHPTSVTLSDHLTVWGFYGRPRP